MFTGLPSADLESIAAITVVKALAKDAYLFREGDLARGFYIVQRGAVNVHRVSAAGKEQIIYVFRVGDSFADVALASDKGKRGHPLATQPLMAAGRGSNLSGRGSWGMLQTSFSAEAKTDPTMVLWQPDH